jgi:hypothetical protein
MPKKNVSKQNQSAILKSLAGRIHTVDSFGRTLISQIVRRAGMKGNQDPQELKAIVSGAYWVGPGKYCVDVVLSFDDGSALAVQVCMQGDIDA